MASVVALTCVIMFRGDIRALMKRIAKIKIAGGELETTQQARVLAEPSAEHLSVTTPAQVMGGQSVQAEVPTAELLRAERTRAYVWEYRYLNHFLVRASQIVLDWFAGSAQPISESLYHTWWTPHIPDPQERDAILLALSSHYLIVNNNGLLQISEKGNEYVGWRGELPTLPKIEP